MSRFFAEGRVRRNWLRLDCRLRKQFRLQFARWTLKFLVVHLSALLKLSQSSWGVVHLIVASSRIGRMTSINRCW